MKPVKHTKDEVVKVSKAGLLSLVAAKLKGRVLFPEKIEETRRYLKNAKIDIS